MLQVRQYISDLCWKMMLNRMLQYKLLYQNILIFHFGMYTNVCFIVLTLTWHSDIKSNMTEITLMLKQESGITVNKHSIVAVQRFILVILKMNCIGNWPMNCHPSIHSCIASWLAEWFSAGFQIVFLYLKFGYQVLKGFYIINHVQTGSGSTQRILRTPVL